MKPGRATYGSIDVTDRVFTQDENTFVSLCVVNQTVNLSKKRQTLCTEMLHWDDYCTQRGLDASKPSMSKLFGPRITRSQLADSFDISGKVYVPRSIVLRPVLCGRKRQVFCAEMQHWDDVREREGDDTMTKSPAMMQLFAPRTERKFAEYNLTTATLVRYCAQTVAARKMAAPLQPFCCEMLHWDEYQKSKLGVEPNPSMEKMFSV